MALKMRPTGLGSGHYKDNVDYGIFCGGIYLHARRSSVPLMYRRRHLLFQILREV